MGASSSIQPEDTTKMVSDMRKSFTSLECVTDDEEWEQMKDAYNQSEAVLVPEEIRKEIYGEGAPQLEVEAPPEPEHICPVCDMKFTSVVKLERHNKYSDLHAKNVALMGRSPNASPMMMKKKGGLAIQRPITPTVDLLFTGSKLFWRTQETYEVSIFVHMPYNIFEIVAFDTESESEIEHVWGQCTSVVDIIGIDTINQMAEEEEAKLSKIKHGSSSGGSGRGTPQIDVLFETCRRNAISNFVFQRIHIIETERPEDDGPKKKILKVNPQTGDPENMDIILDEMPIELTETVVKRKRRATEEDFANQLRAIDEATQSLKADAKKATRLQMLSAISMKAFSDALVNKEKMAARMESATIAEKRWWWSMSKVMNQCAVERTKKRLAQLGIEWVEV